MTPAKPQSIAYTYGALVCAAGASLVVSLALLALVVALFPIWLLTMPMRILTRLRG